MSVGEQKQVIVAAENRELKKAIAALSGNWGNSLSRLEYMATERSKSVQVQAGHAENLAFPLSLIIAQ
jgi:hypothetical protein